MIVTTGNDVAMGEIVQYLGIVRGIVVRATGIGSSRRQAPPRRSTSSNRSRLQEPESSSTGRCGKRSARASRTACSASARGMYVGPLGDTVGARCWRCRGGRLGRGDQVAEVAADGAIEGDLDNSPLLVPDGRRLAAHQVDAGAKGLLGVGQDV